MAKAAAEAPVNGSAQGERRPDAARKQAGILMMKTAQTFSSFSTDDLEATKTFYAKTLGLDVQERPGMGLLLELPDGAQAFIYPKPDHQPATFTILNFVVEDIDEAVDQLTARGVPFDRYEGFDQDEKGIARSESPGDGPSIAWFKDPAGNILSVLHDGSSTG